MAEVKAIQPENDVFCSVYRKDYLFWKEYDHRKKFEHNDTYRLTAKKAKLFLREATKPDFSKMEEYLDDMRELNKLRFLTLYSVEYVPKSSYKVLSNVDPEKFSPKNDKFLIDGAVRFGIPQGQVPAPLPTSRRVLAYSAYDDYRTPLSTYQDIHGRLGYDRVKLAADGGYWRMGPRYDHEKEMADIQNVMRREADVLSRESEEKRMEEELMKKQIEEEREDLIRRSLEKRESRKRGTITSARFGMDPRQKTSSTPQSGDKKESAGSKEGPEVPKAEEGIVRKKICDHTMLEHEKCLRHKKGVNKTEDLSIIRVPT